ncbi:MAG: hypothetical protein DIAAKJNI_00404 [Candidatus Argoarchaeum ethanivorans]|uniref:Uncharacterized protein n=1 Tax=Candidatus Argoarchaeum ethanivorans TaxID=2608793 RepID=A0A811TEB5_9EURY|nr:MAG: hypothetical protein DIAAKJNI_00404 [Candidatus Argoarchaeum ethanivorans]
MFDWQNRKYYVIIWLYLSPIQTELRLLTDHSVITLKYRGKILVRDAFAGYRGAYQEDMQEGIVGGWI